MLTNDAKRVLHALYHEYCSRRSMEPVHLTPVAIT